MRLLPRTCLQVKRSHIRNWASMLAAAAKTSKPTIKMHKQLVNNRHRRRMLQPKPTRELQLAEAEKPQRTHRLRPIDEERRPRGVLRLLMNITVFMCFMDY